MYIVRGNDRVQLGNNSFFQRGNPLKHPTGAEFRGFYHSYQVPSMTRSFLSEQYDEDRAGRGFEVKKYLQAGVLRVKIVVFFV